jgi:RNA polymerase sigma factor (TIGR02999 family)
MYNGAQIRSSGFHFNGGRKVDTESRHQITVLLKDWRRGDSAALDRLMPLVYDELRRRAHRYMVRERPGRTLQTTGLVNEAYLRLIDAGQVDWKDRAHFFAISANLMRRILVEAARTRGSRKRGGELRKVEFNDAVIGSVGRDTDLAALDDALTALAEIDPREAKVVELRFFGGLSVAETAEVLGVAERTVMRDWNHARVWLLQALDRQEQT